MKARVAMALVAVGGMMACNAHPVSSYLPVVEVERQQPTTVDPSERLDILWVIDNSGSMCQEQAILRDNFDRFADRLDDALLDFHIGVTTTHMEDDFPLEPVAKPGHLQSTPQPLPGFDHSCWTAVDHLGQPIEGDYTPIREQIAAAVACMETPDESLLNVSDDDIACALGCRSLGQCEPDECGGVRLFPDPSTYRELPKVLRSDAYRQADGTLDVARLKADFACMATVGTRGYGFEKGLDAIVAAVSPELTGGTDGQPLDPTAPNFGFIRDDARFAAIFVTDENDCSHDGSLSERAGACADDLCDYWNHPDVVDSPLVDPTVARDAMLANLRATKGAPEFNVADVLVASIHGRSDRYDGPVVPDASCRVDDPTRAPTCAALEVCDESSYSEVAPTCASELGTAYSGDRYERFLRSFPEGHYYPEPGADPDTPLTGWMCTGDFVPAIDAIGEFLRSVPAGCITREIETCNPAAPACPDHAGGEPGQCVARPNSDEYFCDSYVQVRVYAEPDRYETLAERGFCDAGDGSYCVVPPDVYDLTSCGGAVSGVKLQWREPDVARETLAGTQLELRWRSFGR